MNFFGAVTVDALIIAKTLKNAMPHRFFCVKITIFDPF
jgi:hypothetical protein